MTEDKPIKILLVEDNPGDARLVREALAEAMTAQFELAYVECLDEALKCLLEGGTDVILLDLELPDAEGLETVTRMYAAAPGVPIVVLTGLDDEALAVRAVREGAQDHLVKGQVDSNLLVRSMRYAIERKRVERQLADMATHDALTGLPNRTLFNDRLTLALAQAQRNRQKVALMSLDFDHFKDINDTLGHAVGDKLLEGVGQRLTSLLRSSDTVARMGGDEFMLLLPEIPRMEDVAKIAQKILEATRKPFVCDDHELHITTSIGVVLYPHDGEDGDTLAKNADMAMYRAKNQGRDNYQCYSDKNDRDGPEREHPDR